MGKFFQMQCLLSGLPSIPHQFRYWINIRRAFSNLYTWKKSKASEWKNLQGMLDALGMEFEGRAHSGIDDARNIARIASRMLKDGCELRVNERMLRRDRAVFLNERRSKRIEARDKQREEQRKQMGSSAAVARPARGIPIPVPCVEKEEVVQEEEKTEEQKDIDRAISERIEKENQERQMWKDHLPYKVVSVSKMEFNMDMYEECETCSDPDSENEIT